MDKLKITSRLFLSTLALIGATAVAESKMDPYEICKVNAEEDRKFMMLRQQGIPLLDIIEKERKLLEKRAKANNISQAELEPFMKLHMSQIAEAYDQPKGINEEHKKKITEEYVNGRLAACIRYVGNMK